MTRPSSSETLAAFAADLNFRNLPRPVVAALERHLLDTIGVALASSTMPFAQAAVDAVGRLSGSGAAMVLGHVVRLPPVWAALVNGTLAHGLDFDDTHTESVVHVSASVVPAALAMIDDRGCSGSDLSGTDLLTALAMGMESNIRIGLVARGRFHDRGFHPTGICGTFASALVASKLTGLDSNRMADALGLCASTAAGSLEFLSDGSWAKRIHGGWAAHAGITAAHFAAAGFSGPRGALDGRFGLYRSHLGERGDLEVLSDDLGRHWHLLDTALKPYPCCHFNHAFLDAALALRVGHEIAAADIDRVTCWIAEREMPVVCEPRQTKIRPQTAYDAKFSLPYAVACMLVHGHAGIDDYEDTAIEDRQVLALAARVDCVADTSSDYPRRFSGRMRIALNDGRQLDHDEPINRGSAERPLSDDAVLDKFVANATRAVPHSVAAQIHDAVVSLESDRDLIRFRRALDATRPAG